MSVQKSFQEWCKVELFGHIVIVGLVSERVIAGEGFIQVDVPKTDAGPGFSRIYGTSAIYCMSPISEDTAMELLKYYRPIPVKPYEIPLLSDSSKYEAPHPSLEETDDENIF